MTTQKLSSEKLVDRKLLCNMTRRRLPHILVAFLVNFFTVSVPFMLWMGDRLERWQSGMDTWELYVKRCLNNLEETMVFHLVFMFILGGYFGIITLGYMMKRRSAHFYHALPQSRETLYTTSVVSALVCAAIGGAVTLAIALIQIASFSLFIPQILGTFFLLLAKNLVYFLVAYAVTVFAGSFSGNGLVQVLMSAVIFFYPIATYAGILLTRGLNATYFWSEYYFSEEIMQWLSPVAYVVYNYLEGVRILPVLLALLVVTALLLGGLAIYKKRAIENSERPIVFAKLGTVLKYMFMFTVTMFAGLFFQAIGYTFFHMVFGYVCGAVLSFMLFNTILAKSPKAMFKGLGGLAVFAVAFSLFLTVVCFDVFGMDDYVADADTLAHAKIEIANAEFDDKEFADPETLAALSAVLKNQRDADEIGVVRPLSNSKTAFTVNTVMYTKLGIPFARTYRVSKYTDGAEDFLRLYADDARMQEKYDTFVKALDRPAAEGYSVELVVNGSQKLSYELDFATFCTLYKQEYGVANYDRVSQPVVTVVEIANVRTDSDDYYYGLYDFGLEDYSWNMIPVFADMTNTLAYLAVEDRKIEAVWFDEYNAAQKMPIMGAYVYDTRMPVTGKYLSGGNLSVYPYKEISLELGEALGDLLIDFDRSSSYARIFTAIDTEYVLHLSYGEKDPVPEDAEIYYGDEYGVKAVVTSPARKYEEYTFVFPKGYVPAEVKAMFE